jgi:hypothetical protein
MFKGKTNSPLIRWNTIQVQAIKYSRHVCCLHMVSWRNVDGVKIVFDHQRAIERRTAAA